MMFPFVTAPVTVYGSANSSFSSLYHVIALRLKIKIDSFKQSQSAHAPRVCILHVRIFCILLLCLVCVHCLYSYLLSVFCAVISDLASCKCFYPCSQLVTSSYSSQVLNRLHDRCVDHCVSQLCCNLIINCNVCVCRKDVSHIVVIFLSCPHPQGKPPNAIATRVPQHFGLTPIALDPMKRFPSGSLFQEVLQHPCCHRVLLFTASAFRTEENTAFT